MSATAVFNTNSPIPEIGTGALLGCLPEFAEDPLALFKKAATDYDEVVNLKLPMANFALVIDPHLIHQILVKEANSFKKAQRDVSIMGTALGNGLVTNNDQASHKKQRKLAQPGFHFRRIQEYAQTMADYSDRYMSTWLDSETRDISDDMFKLTMYIVGKTLFDADMDELEGDAKVVSEAMHIVQEVIDRRFNKIINLPDWVPTPDNIRIKSARKKLDQTIQKMIDSRTEDRNLVADRGDLMSLLLQTEYEDGSKMSNQQLMDELITLFMAGHETTSNALTWTLYFLSNNPLIQSKLQEELDEHISGLTPDFEELPNLEYTEMVIKESMRMMPPAWVLNARQTTQDVQLGNYFFPKDSIVFISPYATHHNPALFPQPDKFDPERFSPEREKYLPRYAYLPFGGGSRVCIGNSFAMMEAKIILATIMKRFEIKPSASQRFEPQAQITLSNKGGMSVNTKRRK